MKQENICLKQVIEKLQNKKDKWKQKFRSEQFKIEKEELLQKYLENKIKELEEEFEIKFQTSIQQFEGEKNNSNNYLNKKLKIKRKN